MACSLTYSSVTSRLFLKLLHLVQPSAVEAPFFLGQTQAELLLLQGVNEMCPVFAKAWQSTQLMVDTQIGVFIWTTNLGLSAACCSAQLQGNLESKATLPVQRARVKIITCKNKRGSAPIYRSTFPVPPHSPFPLQSDSIPHHPPADRCWVSRRIIKIYKTCVPPLTITFWHIEDLCRQTALTLDRGWLYLSNLNSSGQKSVFMFKLICWKILSISLNSSAVIAVYPSRQLNTTQPHDHSLSVGQGRESKKR